jgi:outer membrane murein-binding lipoprotein Lpp
LLLSPLRALGARSAAAVGDSYARAAQTLLTQYERLEDDAAERRYQRRAAQPTELPARGGTTVAKS